MTTTCAWEAETVELIDRVNRELEELRTEMEKRLAPLEQKKLLLEGALRTYRELRGIASGGDAIFSRRDLEGKTHREILRLIAACNDQLLVASTAIRMMKDAQVFRSPENAYSVVYHVLQRSPEFVKVGRGVYKLDGGSQERGSHPKAGKRGTARGLVKAAEEMNRDRPGISKRGVQKALVSGGVDAPLERKKLLPEGALKTNGELRGSASGRGATLSPRDLEGKTHREILRLVAARNDGLFVARDAIRMMKAAEVFRNPENAYSIVFHALQRSPEFVKVGRGVYRLEGKARERGSHPRAEKHRSPTGLVKAVEQTCRDHPGISRREVQNALVSGGFDFMGKDPTRAMNMAWVRLGYAKEDRQGS